MENKTPRVPFRDTLALIEPRIRNGLVFLSFLALLSVGAHEISEFLQPELKLPFLSVGWGVLFGWLRTAIWFAFVAYIAVYTLFSGTPFSFLKQRIPELIICLSWLPAGGSALISSSAAAAPGEILSLDVLQLIGSLAHGWRIVRWLTQRFSQHPLIVIGSAALLLMSSTAALLHYFEPSTYPRFWDALWFTLVTIATVGYGDMVPHTDLGKVIAGVLIITGVGLYATIIGIVSEWVKSKLLASHMEDGESVESRLFQALEKLNAKVDQRADWEEQLLEELRANNALLQQQLARRDDDPESVPAEDRAAHRAEDDGGSGENLPLQPSDSSDHSDDKSEAPPSDDDEPRQ